MPKKTKHRYKVGDRVRFRLGARVLTVRVVEDRGQIGVGGEQLVRIEVPLEATEPQVFEVRADMLTPASRRRVAACATLLGVRSACRRGPSQRKRQRRRWRAWRRTDRIRQRHGAS